MYSSIINAAAIIIGSLIGMAIRHYLSERYEKMIFNAAGIIASVLGIQMVLKTAHIMAMALALIFGGLLGTWLNIEGRILHFGEFLKSRFVKSDDSGNFALGFLSASILYCSGSLAIIGSFRAGVEGDYSLILTKSILDGSISIFFAGAMGLGVAFSSISVLIYQGSLTLASVWLKGYVDTLMIGELSAIGGCMLIMVGINLLKLKQIKTGDFLPGMAFTVVFVLLMPFVSFL